MKFLVKMFGFRYFRYLVLLIRRFEICEWGYIPLEKLLSMSKWPLKCFFFSFHFLTVLEICLLCIHTLMRNVCVQKLYKESSVHWILLPSSKASFCLTLFIVPSIWDHLGIKRLSYFCLIDPCKPDVEQGIWSSPRSRSTFRVWKLSHSRSEPERS